jgi:hypothetical protein
VNYLWDLPLGKSDGVLGKLRSGWSVSGVTTVQDGTPLTITDARGGTIYGTQTSCAEYTPGMGPGTYQPQEALMLAWEVLSAAQDILTQTHSVRLRP